MKTFEQGSERTDSLDGLRGVAILAVIATHAKFSLDAAGHNPVLAPVDLGWTGVDLFFVLSGFLISRILITTRSSPVYYRRFMLARMLRIFPLYFAILTTFSLLILLGFFRDFPPVDLIWFWTYCSNIGIAAHGGQLQAHLAQCWSLAIEEQFYLVWPLLVLLVRPVHLPWVILAGCIASMTGRTAFLAAGGPPMSAHVLTWFRLEPLMLGALVAVHATGHLRISSARLSILLMIPGLLLTIAGVALSGTAMVDAFWNQTLVDLGDAMFFAGLVCHLVAHPTGLPRGLGWLSSRLLVHIGRRSYCIYLIHQIIFKPLHNHHGGERLATWIGDHCAPLVGREVGMTVGSVSSLTLIFVGMTIAALLVAEVSWKLLEGPCLHQRSILEAKWGWKKLHQARPAEAPAGGAA